MATFKFDQLVDLDRADIVSAALGAATGAAYATADIGKFVKLEAASGDANWVPVADGDDLEGHIVSVEPYTVNLGFKFGSVQKNGRQWVINANAAGAGSAMAVGDFVVAAAQTVAIGTAGKTKVKDGAGTAFKWRVIRVLVDGAIGDEVLIERV